MSDNAAVPELARAAGDGAVLTDQPTARYLGRRNADHTGSVAVVMREDAAGLSRPLPWRLDLQNHSSAGLAWGDAGPGSAQLALAMLADALGPQTALQLHQLFQREFIAGLTDDVWEITREQIQDWIGRQRAPER